MILDDVVILRRLIRDLIKCVDYYLEKVKELESENKKLRERLEQESNWGRSNWTIRG